MFIRRLLLLSFIALISGSCIEKVTNIHLDEDAGVPVLFSALRNDDTIRVFTGYTAGIFDYSPEEQVERNARVVLFRNGTPVDTATPGQDNYSYFHTLPQAGTTYRIEAHFPGGKLLSGATTFPASLPVQLTGSEMLQLNDRKAFHLRLHIADPAGTNYYLFVVRPNMDYWNDNLTESSDFPIPPGTQIIEPYGWGHTILALSDRGFDGREMDVNLYFDATDIDDTNGFVFYQAICDEAYYEYLKYLSTGDYYSGDPFGTMEHENPHGNVDGGYGFVGSLLQRTDTITP